MSDAVWFGVAGGLLSNILLLVKLSKTPKEERPITFTDPLYWVQMIVLALLGGFFVFVYERSKVGFNPILAMHVGASAPIAAQQLVSSAPPIGRIK
jgi:hypothetical protein